MFFKYWIACFWLITEKLLPCIFNVYAGWILKHLNKIVHVRCDIKKEKKTIFSWVSWLSSWTTPDSHYMHIVPTKTFVYRNDSRLIFITWMNFFLSIKFSLQFFSLIQYKVFVPYNKVTQLLYTVYYTHPFKTWQRSWYDFIVKFL